MVRQDRSLPPDFGGDRQVVREALQPNHLAWMFFALTVAVGVEYGLALSPDAALTWSATSPLGPVSRQSHSPPLPTTPVCCATAANASAADWFGGPAAARSLLAQGPGVSPIRVGRLDP